MNLRKVKTIYLKEMLDTLRDRRTLVSMILVPILLFPIIMFGMSGLIASLIKKAEERPAQITILGEENAPHLTSQVFQNGKFTVVEEKDYENAIREKRIEAALVFSEDFEQRINSEDSAQAFIYYDKAEIKSEIAAEKLADLLWEYSDSVITSRLQKREIDRSLLHPVNIQRENVASKEKMGGFMLSMFLPYMIIILSLTGAMYPAIDLTAGEKERGTMETILVSPVSRGELATGKFFCVMTASVVTAVLATISMSISAGAGFAQMSSFTGEGAQFSIKITSILVILVLFLPISALFSSLLLSLSLFAKSYKEAQSYITPLMIVVIMPAMISFMPGVELNWGLAFVPIINVSLALKEVLLGTYNWEFIGLIFVSTILYASFSIFVTRKLFEKEHVLFRT
ncbi:MAG: ABC transporter permease subunit/CPBP intramembrane protease [Candidatus Zixiibacteriota bacterium]